MAGRPPLKRIVLTDTTFPIIEAALDTALGKVGAEVQQAAKAGNIPAIASAATRYTDIEAALLAARRLFSDDAPAEDDDEGSEGDD